ncbi:MAG: ABC transporter substrate-binding protein [Acidimicrobiales bacterium]
MSRFGLRYRQAVGGLTTANRARPVLQVAVAVMLVAGILTAVVQGSESSSSSTRSGGGGTQISEGQRGGTSGSNATAGGGPGGTGTTVARSGSGGPGGPGGSGGSSPAGGSSAGGASGGTSGTGPGAGGANGLTATDRGVTATTIKVAFPWYNTASALTGGGVGVPANGPTDEDPQAAIRTYVDDINQHGGINGRKIDPILQQYNPNDATDMRAKCIQFTQDQKVFAVVDIGAWNSDAQLCVTQENHTPLITSLGTVKVWTTRGAPYLWWAAPTAEATLDNLTLWAKEKGQFAGATVGVAVADKEEDKVAGARLKADFARLGIPLHYEELPYNTSDAQAAIPAAVNRMQAAHVNRVIMLLPLPSFNSWLSEAEAQVWRPRYVLTDYDDDILVAQILYQGHPASLEGAVGTSFQEIGESNDPRTFRPGETRCNNIWKQHNPKAPVAQQLATIMNVCQNISIFAEAARRAGPNLTRDTWAAAMGTIKNLVTSMSPEMTWGPGHYAGAELGKAIVLTNQGCPSMTQNYPGGACHKQTEDFRPLRTFP